MGIFGRDDSAPDRQAAQPTEKPAPSPTPAAPTGSTIIAGPTIVEGRISGSGEIIVNGLVKGTIDASGSVAIADQGSVEATVHGRLVSVAGTVAGDITADEKIELQKTARVEGNITAPRILIKDGATFKGQVNMEKSGVRPSVRTSTTGKNPGLFPDS